LPLLLLCALFCLPLSRRCLLPFLPPQQLGPRGRGVQVGGVGLPVALGGKVIIAPLYISVDNHYGNIKGGA
jgi:hypothetical protein